MDEEEESKETERKKTGIIRRWALNSTCLPRGSGDAPTNMKHAYPCHHHHRRTLNLLFG